MAAGDLGGQGALDPQSLAAVVLGEQGDAGCGPELLPAFSPGSQQQQRAPRDARSWAGERREGLSLSGRLLLWLLEGSKMCQNDFFALSVHVSYPDSEKA